MTDSSTFPYQQVAQRLRRDIASKTLAEHQALPSERELGPQFGVARETIRQAIALLKAEGLVQVQPGRGIFVSAPAPRVTLMPGDCIRVAGTPDLPTDHPET